MTDAEDMTDAEKSKVFEDHLAAVETDTLQSPPDTREHACLELMGHRQRLGQIQEVVRFGVTLIRIDFWDSVTGGAATEYYAPSAIYCVSPISRAALDEYEERQKRYYSPPRPRELPAPENNDDEDPESLDDPASEYNRQDAEHDPENDYHGVEFQCP